MNSKPKSIDMGSLIQKVTKRARELLKKKSKPQNKGKTANGTSRYSKSKRQKLLIGGVKVKLGDGEKQKILNIIGVKTQEANKVQAQAHLVELLKLKTIEKINKKLVDYTMNISNDSSKEGKLSDTDADEINKIEKILDDVGRALELSTTEDFENFKTRQTELARIYKESSDDGKLAQNYSLSKSFEDAIYKYKLFTGDIESYKLCNIEKEITTLNIFRLFHDLTNMNEDLPNELRKGGAYTDVYLKYNSDGTSIENGLKEAETGEFAAGRVKVYELLLSEVKKTIKEIRENFVDVELVKKLDKKGDTAIPGMEGVKRAPMNENNDLLGNNFQNIIQLEEDRTKFRKLLEDIENGGKYNTINFNGRLAGKDADGKNIKKVDAYSWKARDSNTFYIYTIEYNRSTSKYEVILRVSDNSNHEQMNILKGEIDSINLYLQNIIDNYRNSQDNEASYEEIERTIKSIYNNYGLLSAKHTEYRPDSWMKSHPQTFVTIHSSLVGGNPVKYKSTGQVVHIMFQNKKYKRVIYVKDKRNTKYCKMNNEYILLSKLKVIE
jgi:hypothetical protein